MAAKRQGLGRGLGALISETPAAAEPPSPPGGVTRIPTGDVRGNPWQPRRDFAPETLQDLVASVRERGVLQPLLVRRAGAGYELIAGERRLRAAQVAELAEVPAIVMDVTDREALELALVENLQREDLNPIEEAEGYRVLTDKFELTQEQVAERVGKARATVANALRLLDLPDAVKQRVAEGSISGGHAKVLLSLESPSEQLALAERAVREGLSVRGLENILARMKRAPRRARVARSDIPSDHLRHLTEQLHQHFGTGVRLLPSRTLANGKKAKGTVEIDFYSAEDLDRLLQLFGLSEQL
jgi:ParB family chromosome partitioning protein